MEKVNKPTSKKELYACKKVCFQFQPGREWIYRTDRDVYGGERFKQVFFSLFRGDEDAFSGNRIYVCAR